MPDLFNNITLSQCESMDDIINWCHQLVPPAYKAKPWTHPELNHGVDLLASDDALNCYMSAYGDMHVSKCKAAMMNFPYEEINGSIEIVDWGCGQGIGSATILDMLKQRNFLQWVKRITLIEPSLPALQRAECNLSKITQERIIIDAINKYMPSNGNITKDTLNSIGYKCANVIHIFSNILDVRAIDLATVARMVASSQGKHYVLCIGPKNGAAYRIEQFCSVFGDQRYFSQIDSVCLGHTKRTGHPYTCMTRCFSYDGSSLDYSRMSLYKESNIKICDDYDLELQIQNKVLSPQKARVAYRLQNIMSVDDIMYIDSILNEVKVDFIIVRPNKGILLVNVFENNLSNCILTEDNKEIIVSDGIGNQVYFQSPIEHINLCQTSIKDGIEELLMSTIEDSRNFRLIKKVVVFTENTIDKVKDFFNTKDEHINYTYLFGNEFIKDKSVSQELYNKISLKYNTRDFDDAVKRKLSKILSPSWHSYQEGRIGVEPKGAQKRLVMSQSTQQKISGVAGSGKTFVLAVRAINAMKRTGGDVLILTYNITLANYLKYRLSEIREDFSWDKIDIFNYHQFFKIRASECQFHVKFGSYEDLTFFEKANKQKRYSAIFVDEVQDYTTEWLRTIMQYFLAPNGEFVVFGDPKQNIYNRPLDSNKDIRLGVIGGEWNRQLNTGRRFTNPRLAKLATSFQSTFFPQLPNDTINTEADSNIGNTFNFQIVNYYDLRADNSTDNLVAKLIDIIQSDTNEVRDFVVLASTIKLLRSIDYSYRQKTGEDTEVTFVSTERFDQLKQIHHVTDDNVASWKFKRDYDSLERTRKMLFTTDKRCLKISTIQSFKGWESPSVIVILEDNYQSRYTGFMPMSPENIYTAITRARENLYVINIGNDYYDQFFKTQSK